MVSSWLSHWFGRRRSARHLRTGLWGERQAARALRSRGYRILHRRLRLGRKGEIDLVAHHAGVLVFVEVKTRSRPGLARPLQAVDHRKRRLLSRAAARYLGRMRRKPAAIRFDVVEVIGSLDGPPPTIRHIEGAFRIDPHYDVPW